MDRREAERGRALVAAALDDQFDYEAHRSVVEVKRKAADKSRADLVAWVGANGAGKTLVYNGQVVVVGERITLVPLASLDPQPAPAPPPPPPLPPAPPPPAPTKGGKK